LQQPVVPYCNTARVSDFRFCLQDRKGFCTSWHVEVQHQMNVKGLIYG
jgi:hypothetical protein